jgi:hypothetical protein
MLLPGMAPACLYEALRSSLLLRKGARTKLRGSSPEWRHKHKPAWQASGVQQLQLGLDPDLSYDDDLLLKIGDVQKVHDTPPGARAPPVG